MGGCEVDLVQFNVDTDGVIAVGSGVVKPVFINGLDFDRFLDTEFAGGEVLLAERNGGHAVLQAYKGFFQVAAVFIVFCSVLETKVEAAKRGQIITQVVADKVFQLQVVILDFGTIIILMTRCLTELDLEITVDLVRSLST
jgi:hypothetical protein